MCLSSHPGRGALVVQPSDYDANWALSGISDQMQAPVQTYGIRPKIRSDVWVGTVLVFPLMNPTMIPEPR